MSCEHEGLLNLVRALMDRLDRHMGDTDLDDPHDPDLQVMQWAARVLDSKHNKAEAARLSVVCSDRNPSDPIPLSVVYRAMRVFGYPEAFVMSALILARDYEGIKDLMYLWLEALTQKRDVDPYRRDIQDLMNDYLVSHLTDVVKRG